MMFSSFELDNVFVVCMLYYSFGRFRVRICYQQPFTVKFMDGQ